MCSFDLDSHPGVGVVARRLAPRGLASPGARRSSYASVVLRSDRLEPRERDQVRSLCERGATWERVACESAAVDAQREWVLSGHCALFESEAHTSPLVQAVLFAHGSTARPTGPVRLMGVVNVTPDSFSDGGRFLDTTRAVEHALALAAAGAQILDVGGESTRPGAREVARHDELARVIPVIRELALHTDLPISVDTRKSEVADAAIDAGASIVNDVSAGIFDARMLSVVARHHAGFVAMHMRGTPSDMQTDPRYDEPVADVLTFLRERAHACLAAGIEGSRLWIDPGIGFGKRLEHNVALLRRLSELRSLGFPLCLGVSRKSFIARLSDSRSAEIGVAPQKSGARVATDVTRPADNERIAGTAAALTAGVLAGAEVLRIHDAIAMHEAAAVASALRR